MNLRRVAELTEQGMMRPAGLAARAKATDGRSGIYAYEQRKDAELPREMKQRFRRHRGAWTFFQSQPPSYRHGATWCSAAGRRIRHLARP